MTGFDFNLSGDIIATIDISGKCLVSDINTNDHKFDLDLDDLNGKLFHCVL